MIVAKDTIRVWKQNIPAHWQVLPLKYTITYNDDKLTDQTDENFEFDYVDIGSVTYGKGIETFQHMKFSDAPSRARRIVKPKDVIMSTVRTYLKATAEIEEHNNPIIVSTGFMVMRARNGVMLPDFLGYIAQSDGLVSEIECQSYGASYPAINAEEIAGLSIPLPPIPEQQAIVRYLDAKCAAIDEAIERHKKIIEKLEEYRKNRITYLVTRGLRSKSMKASGSDWYGDIPSDWEVKRFKYIAKVMSNLVDPEPYKDLPQVGPDIIEKDSGRLVGIRTVEESGIISGNHLFYEGQLLYSKVRPALNKVVTAPFTGLCSADMYPIEAEINSEYLKWLMLSKPFTEQTRIIASIRVKMPKINQDELGNVVCVVPPTEEQEKIAMAIQEMCNKVQTSIDKHNDIINKLDEYRKSIIYNAVTGKIDCRTETQP